MTPRSVVSGATFECLEIQLSPLLARALLDVHPAELGRPLVALDDIWGADAERLRNRIIDAASWAERFDLVHAMLTKRLARHSDATHRPDPVAGDAWRRIVRSGGHLPIGTLPGQYGVGRTQFWKRFREEVGLSPKQAARIVRFDRALRLLGAGAGLAEVAAEAGYSDQPHLNREFADLAGLSPGGLSPGGLRNHPSWRSRVTLHRTSGHADPPIGIPRASSLSPAHS
ncbi:helix-turn-helix domain-containing protein [Intrasporangium sp. DVR]|uniref:AraC family transcriptional regulator n=1 Tax=Intrasporangium sp. DVR TaxID=3127867 RepID=UPI00333EC3C9